MATKVQFVVILFLMYSLCTLMVSTAVAMGRGLLPDNQHVLTLPRSCALPCIFGITPGETRRSQAVEGIAETAEFPVDQLGGALSFQTADDQGNLISGLIISDEDSIVQYARLYTRRWAGLGVRLGDLMRDRMPPTDVYRSCSGTFPARLLLTFEGTPRISFAAIIADGVSPFSPVSVIDVTTSDEFFVQTLATVFGNGCYIPSEWRGFGRTWLYASQPQFPLD
jgi:hypothetical protein